MGIYELEPHERNVIVSLLRVERQDMIDSETEDHSHAVGIERLDELIARLKGTARYNGLTVEQIIREHDSMCDRLQALEDAAQAFIGARMRYLENSLNTRSSADFWDRLDDLVDATELARKGMASKLDRER